MKNSVMDNPYNEVPYPTLARHLTHPEHLAAVGDLFGMEPEPVERCRVLEVGCGNGNNLISMAFALPGASFAGIDLATEPIAAGCDAIAELNLKNISLAARDLRELGPDFGEFDYIIAHGVYSWIPEDARDRLLGLCQELLSPQGIAFISYNIYPGHHIREMFRDMLLYHTRHSENAADRVEQARRFLNFYRDARTGPEAWRGAIDSEIERMLTSGILFHDEMSPVNHAVYFHEFVEHARTHGLQYLGEANLHEMFDHRNVLGRMSSRLLEREQYLDFIKARRFRQTLLCRDEVWLNHNPSPEDMDRFLFSSPATPVDGELEGESKVRIAPKIAAGERVALALGDAYPLPVAFEELLPYAGSRASLRELLFSMTIGGFAQIHSYEFPCEESVTARPVASALARWQARTSSQVTTLCHRVVELDPIGRDLLLLLDGTRDHEAIAADVGRMPGAPTAESIQEKLPDTLAWLARIGLLSA